MKLAAKGVLYVLFLMVAVACFGRFRAAYSTAPVRAVGGADESAAALDAGSSADTVDAGSTNPVVAASTNASGAAVSSAVGATNAGAGGAASTLGAPKAAGRGNAQALYLSGFVLGMLGLAGLGAWDISQFVARKAAHGLGVDLSPIEGDPEYDAAEQAWANGEYLEAINLLREFLKRRPNQQHAALRIAEIYEKDLQNPLAAALELEDVLQRRLPREKWGWTAVHLANLYSGKLNQTDKALAILHRIVDEYPETAAAKKARQRLGVSESVASASGPGAGPVAGGGVDDVTAAAEDESMPRGFKMRKK